jgi:magnesium chelatase family protein
MVGGGPNMSPGEITRADQGVLFLDELPEFGRDVLEALRQPMEEGRVAVSRVGRATIFPARFQLVAAMNPCPCGFAGSSPACGCGVRVPDRYQRRCRSLRDRIDLWISGHASPLASRGPEPGSVVRETDRGGARRGAGMSGGTA